MAKVFGCCLTIGDRFAHFLCDRFLQYANLGSHGPLSFVELLTKMLITERPFILKRVLKCCWIIWMRPTTTPSPTQDNHPHLSFFSARHKHIITLMFSVTVCMARILLRQITFKPFCFLHIGSNYPTLSDSKPVLLQ